MANAAVVADGIQYCYNVARKSCQENAELYKNCSWCYDYWSHELTPSQFLCDKNIDVWAKHVNSNKHRSAMGLANIRSGNGAPSGAFAFTLTKSPKDPLTVGDMLTAVRKIMSQKSCKVVKYAWYYEDKGRDDNGDPIHPHIHGMYETETGGRIESKHFKRAWPVWDPSKPMGAGFQGGYHRPVRSDEGYLNYIKKDGGMSESMGHETE